MRHALLDAVQAASCADRLAGVIVRGAGGNFVGGADIREFDHPAVAPHLPELIAAIETCPAPVIAAIDGACLGGGFEIALGCDARIATREAVVGLPEVTLGLIPGAGGTLRTLPLIGAAAAIALITSGSRVKAPEALEMGLLDQLASNDLLADALGYFDRAPTKRLLRTLLPRPATDEAIAAAEAAALRRGRGQDAVPEAVAAIKRALVLPADAALASEREVSLRLRMGPQSKALRYLFFAERHALKRAVSEGAAPAKKIGVVGAGRMGQGIALACARRGQQVQITDHVSAARDACFIAIRTEADRLEKRGRIKEVDSVLANIAVVRPEDLVDADLVVEAIIEDMEAKKALLQQLDAVMPARTILATNTSYLDVDALAAVTTRPDRVVGLHFFNPAHLMRLVEVVDAAQTSPTTLASVLGLVRVLGKVPVVTGVGEGFIGNAIFAAYREQCEFLLDEGCLPQQIDAAMTAFGFPMGPFAVFDLAGLDIAWARRRRLAEQRDPATRYSSLADQLCEMGRFGRRAGAGWYDYSVSDRGAPDPLVESLILQTQTNPANFTPTEIQWRLLSSMINTSARLVASGVARDTESIDLALVHGFGFPAYLGGPIHWARRQLPDDIRAAIAALVAASGKGYTIAPNLDAMLWGN
ncbi:3-hydroxyacyl-CoA dehydrogenase NAD-binding domain-containing protein [Devosia alba]|uniref:3-hydroxyacyl-CoA dehydrogenase NAD-binding domain-containing protein n=1 Tax=Devosia alba TaxID=3152360 RepID=UPI0032675BAA